MLDKLEKLKEALDRMRQLGIMSLEEGDIESALAAWDDDRRVRAWEISAYFSEAEFITKLNEGIIQNVNLDKELKQDHIYFWMGKRLTRTPDQVGGYYSKPEIYIPMEQIEQGVMKGDAWFMEFRDIGDRQGVKAQVPYMVKWGWPLNCPDVGKLFADYWVGGRKNTALYSLPIYDFSRLRVLNYANYGLNLNN